MATPTAASPRGVRRPVVCFFLFQAQASASGPSFVRLFYSPFFYSGGLRHSNKRETQKAKSKSKSESEQQRVQAGMHATRYHAQRAAGREAAAGQQQGHGGRAAGPWI